MGSQPKKKPKSLLKVNSLNFDASSSGLKRIDPLTAFYNLPATPVQTATKSKGKQKAQPNSILQGREISDDKLWVDIYEPRTRQELAVHNRKVEDVRHWLEEAFEGGPSGKLRKYRRILALTGPAGTAKTATVRVLAQEMDFEILEWRNAMAETSNIFSDSTDAFSNNYDLDYETIFSKFEAFLARASSYGNIFGSSSSSPSSSSTQSESKRRIILLEDLPNILHTNTKTQFHAAIQNLLDTPNLDPVPIIFIVSDAGLRGEASDERLATGFGGRDNDNVIDIRTVLPKDILHGPYVTQIRFNPIATTYLTKTLQVLVKTHYASLSGHTPPSKDTLDVIVESSNGDIRSAIMALQFACVVEMRSAKKKGAHNPRVVLESVTRREQSLALFHLMGKVLYNKRKGDPPAPSASAKDIQKEKEIDKKLKDPPPLPVFLEEHERKASRVDVDQIYADSPIDSGLFSLYIHQNYPQFCNDIEHVDGVADWLSWVDSSGGEHWYQANPHQFHLVALGTLHSLPTPVTRRNQKVFKPSYFDYISKEKEVFDAVRDVRSWTQTQSGGEGRWTNSVVATELGGVLRARTMYAFEDEEIPPAQHRLFSNLAFVRDEGGAKPLGEFDDVGDEDEMRGTPGSRGWGGGYREKKGEEAGSVNGGWLENDDIEEF